MSLKQTTTLSGKWCIFKLVLNIYKNMTEDVKKLNNGSINCLA